MKNYRIGQIVGFVTGSALTLVAAYAVGKVLEKHGKVTVNV